MRLNKLYTILKVIPMVALMVFVSSCTKDDDGEKPVVNQRDFSVADYLTASSGTQQSQYNTLYLALEKAGMLETLGSGTFTLLAPSDAAFAAAGVDIDGTSAADLTTVLEYHLIPSDLETLDDGRITTVNGASINVSGGIVNGSATATAEFGVANGRIYNLDAVLFPPVGNLNAVLAAYDSLSLAAAAFAKSNIGLGGSSNRTIFAPDNPAMRAAGLDEAGIDAATADDIDAILEYHIVASDLFSPALVDGRYATTAGALTDVPGVEVATGDELTVNGAEVTMGNLIATNGVVHMIDDVLSFPTTMLDGLGPNADVSFGNDAVLYTGLYDGMVRAGLDVSLFGDLTTFYSVAGPCCAAFNEAAYPVDADLLDALNAHIFEGYFDPYSVAAEGGTRFESVGGDKYVATASDNGAFINGTWFNAFGSTSTAGTNTLYDGRVFTTFGGGVLSGLPSDDLVTVLDNAGYTLFAAALTNLGIGTGDFTVFAIDDATFTTATGLTTTGEVAAASEDDLADVLNHVIPNWYFSVDINDGSLPTFTATNDVTVALITDADGDTAILLDSGDLANVVKVTGTDIATASNGVVHTVDGLISFVE